MIRLILILLTTIEVRQFLFKIQNYLLSSVLLLVAGTVQILADQPSLRYYVEEESSDGQYADRRLLFVEENGVRYLIEQDKEDWYNEHFYKDVFATRDLNGDGINEAILQTQRGGNCCGPTFFIISRVREGFYTIVSHPELTGWPSLEVKVNDTTPELWVKNVSEGAGNNSMQETLTILRFKHGNIEQVAKHYNRAQLDALIEITAEELSQSKNQVLEIDLDSDGTLDQMSCSYWRRWGAVTCKIFSSKFGKLALSTGCNRVGVLESSTNGMKDLVCNRSSVFKFNGEEFDG